MPEYAWICLNKPDSEYASGTKYAKTSIYLRARRIQNLSNI